MGTFGPSSILWVSCGPARPVSISLSWSGRASPVQGPVAVDANVRLRALSTDSHVHQQLPQVDVHHKAKTSDGAFAPWTSAPDTCPP